VGLSGWRLTIVEVLACQLVDENVNIRIGGTDEEECKTNNTYSSEDPRAVLE